MTGAPSSQRHRLAFHEAGHCVVAEALGLSIDSLELLNGESDGIMRLACDNAHLKPVERIAVCVAGLMGGDIGGEPALTDEGVVDSREAYGIALTANEAEARVLVEFGRLLASSLLGKHTKRLHVVANALGERRRLTAADLAALTA